MISCDHLVQLNIQMSDNIDSKSAQSLASFLSSTKSLRELSLTVGASVQTTSIVLGGLSRNKSISMLSLTELSLYKSQLGSWKTLFKSNRMLRDFSLKIKKTKESLPVLSEFPRFLASNYWLLSISFEHELEFQPYMFQVQDIMRRNLTLLHRATDFGMGRHTKRCAEAFECLCLNESLMKKVQGLNHGTERDAMAKIKVAARHLEENFMVIAGVVRESVVCNRKHRLQLDSIGLDNWLKIRSYLKVSDIRDSPR
ncbi:unnamed protein product, partial [Ixodes hexagonus]